MNIVLLLINKKKQSIIMKKLSLIFLFSTLFVFCITNLKAQSQTEDYRANNEKMSTILQLMKFAYVDTIMLDKYVEKAISEMLKELDPHTAYISKEDVKRTNEPLLGNFEGVGIQFQLIKDTIVVVAVINGGPSEKVGVLAGDKFLKVDTAIATGKNVDNKWVFDRLRGPKGTEVKILMLRRGQPNPIEFKIIRDKIPINSIDAYFMANKEVGYIKLDRFAQTTMDEFQTAITELKIKGMKHLILDLRGNSGGYLNTAIQLSDEFLEKNKLIVYTEGAYSAKQPYNSTEKGSFEKGRLIILIDEGSASASEIVSGAIQDWDRGIIMGRRSFGKGLVQKPYNLYDGSIIRLTTSRYHTPTGRCIQKPYEEGVEEYYKDLMNRMKHLEMISADSVKFPDSLKYVTPNGRIVYGGGGIMPDIFVPMDTNKTSYYYSKLARAGLFNQYTMNVLDNQRAEMKAKYPTFESFKNEYTVDKKALDDFKAFATQEGVSDSLDFDFTIEMKRFLETNKDSINNLYKTISSVNQESLNTHVGLMFSNYINKLKEEYYKNQTSFDTDKYISYQLRFYFARNLFDFTSGIQIWYEIDEIYIQALKVIADEKLFKKMKVQN